MLARPLGGGGDLHQATRIGGDQQPRAGVEHVRRLAVTQLVGGNRVEDVVDPGRAAAQRGAGDLPDRHAGDRAQQLSGLVSDALRVAEVAGIVVGDGQLEGVPGRHRPQLDEQLGDVPDLGGERLRTPA